MNLIKNFAASALILGAISTSALASDYFPAGAWTGTYTATSCTDSSQKTSGAATLNVTNEVDNSTPDLTAVAFEGSLELSGYPNASSALLTGVNLTPATAVGYSSVMGSPGQLGSGYINLVGYPATTFMYMMGYNSQTRDLRETSAYCLDGYKVSFEVYGPK